MGRRDCRGVAWFFIIVVVAAVLGTAGMIAIPASIMLTNKDRTVVKPDEAVCECGHRDSMKTRLEVAKAAMKSIDDLMKAQSAKNPNEMYSDDLYEAGKTTNQRAVNKVPDADKTGSGETRSRNCSPDIDAPTKCMEASLQAHENVHQDECLKFDSRFRNYKFAKTMNAFWQEDRDGYQKEVEYLDRHLKRLTVQCAQTTYIGPETKEEQQQRHAGSKRRVSKYVAVL